MVKPLKRSLNHFFIIYLYNTLITLNITNMDNIEKMIEEYGKVGIATHVVLSLGFFAGFYFLVSRKWINPLGMLKRIGYDTSSKSDYVNKATDGAMAYMLYKGTMFIRLPLTFAIVPLIVNKRKKTNKDEIQEDKKDNKQVDNQEKVKLNKSI